jgi:hypothetical protein
VLALIQEMEHATQVLNVQTKVAQALDHVLMDLVYAVHFW